MRHQAHHVLVNKQFWIISFPDFQIFGGFFVDPRRRPKWAMLSQRASRGNGPRFWGRRRSRGVWTLPAAPVRPAIVWRKGVAAPAAATRTGTRQLWQLWHLRQLWYLWQLWHSPPQYSPKRNCSGWVEHKSQTDVYYFNHACEGTEHWKISELGNLKGLFL
jgi:hypothetical protein